MGINLQRIKTSIEVFPVRVYPPSPKLFSPNDKRFFFPITGQTMESFVKSLDGDVKEVDSDENQFVFALAGIVTSR